MEFGKLAKKILPKRAFDSLRHAKWGRERRRVAALPPLKEKDFSDILVDGLNLRAGDLVYVHSGMDGLSLSFPFYRILFLIQEIIGPTGTLVFPTYPNHRISSYEWLRQGNIFDIRRTPSYTGILTEFARRQRQALRSLHPTKSVCAIGRAAKDLTATHQLSPYPYDTNSPYYKLIAGGGKIIGLGATTNHISFGYCVDDAFKENFPVRVYHNEVFAAPCINYQGERVIVNTYAHDMNTTVHPDMPQWMSKYVSSEACRDLIVRGMKFFRADAAKLFAEMMELAKRGIIAYPRSVWKQK
ncbi:MAG TPA: AAC(3) family N-acetyltransferase [Pyrinomonadaceae bacterium]|jgi:aminoglycoside 3-N-acetyltransferase|nr:AAC(3) family N-acetyltransferase [Pyrinomonadaceae bacterium]